MQRRELDLRDLDAVVSEAKRLLHSGYDKAGAWDLSQVCLHIAQPMNQTIDGFVGEPSRGVRFMMRVMRPFIMRSFFKTRRIRAGLPAPEGSVPVSCDETEAVGELESAVTRLKVFAGPWRKHPMFGELTAQQWREFHVIHSMHHLGFLIPHA